MIIRKFGNPERCYHGDVQLGGLLHDITAQSTQYHQFRCSRTGNHGVCKVNLNRLMRRLRKHAIWFHVVQVGESMVVMTRTKTFWAAREINFPVPRPLKRIGTLPLCMRLVVSPHDNSVCDDKRYLVLKNAVNTILGIFFVTD